MSRSSLAHQSSVWNSTCLLSVNSDISSRQLGPGGMLSESEHDP